MPKPARRASTTTRKRVPRNTLSRERVIEGALALIDAEGLDAVTMPGLAKSLGVGTMSLYRHVADKDDLVNAVAERVLGGVTVPDGDPDGLGRPRRRLPPRPPPRRSRAPRARAHSRGTRPHSRTSVRPTRAGTQHPSPGWLLRRRSGPDLLHVVHLRVRVRDLGAPSSPPAARHVLRRLVERFDRSTQRRLLPEHARIA